MVAKNFKFLSKYHKDTQKIWAQILGVTQSTISAYANGKMPIPTDFLKAISTRYNVSIDDLMNKDLSLEYDIPKKIHINDAAIFADQMYPILTSNTAKSNDSFNYAYRLWCSYLQIEDINNLYRDIKTLEHAVSLFQKAWKELNTYVALANSISVILFVYSLYSQRSVKALQEVISNGSNDYINLETLFLQDPRVKRETNPYARQQKDFFEKYDDLVYHNIKLLKSNSRFSELGDFYLAICNLLGFTEDYIEYEYSSRAGICMLDQLCKLDNEYALRFWDYVPQIS